MLIFNSWSRTLGRFVLFSCMLAYCREARQFWCQSLCFVCFSVLIQGRPLSEQAEMADVLEQLEARSAELGVSDVQLSLSSLEEVFLTIARKVWPCVPV